EDLDFTLINRKLNEKNILSEIIDKICQKANKTFGSSLEFFKIELEREEYGQEAYKAVVHFRGLTGISKIDIDFTFYENVELEPNFREIYHTYSDKEDFGHPKIKIYQLEEIAAEKLRAISYIYGYPRNRDIYDVWYLYKNGKLDLVKVSEIFKKKCLFKKIDDTAIKKINSKYLDRFSKYWKAQLGHQLGNLPDFNLVAEDFLSFINDLNL
ncbi:MAG: nucleotidyl transferase AbiEii/AbiGii toxin family protein, partial [Candidatus Aminicenantia bacterium]